MSMRDLTLYSMIYAMGLRLGEALAINIEDIGYKKKQTFFSIV
jgi:site-specific recombinase XerD